MLAGNHRRGRYAYLTYPWVALGCLALTVALLWHFWAQGASPRDPRAAARLITPRGELDANEKSTIALFRKASPSVVHITTLTVARDFFTLNLLQIPEGTGSGFIWDESGNIVTNFHVIQNADAAQVTLADHSTWKARRVGAAPDKDLAVLRIDGPRDPAPPDPHRVIQRSSGGAKRLCHRQSFRSRPNSNDRGDQRSRAGDRVRDASSDSGRHSDRRGDQPRQLRRAFAGQRRSLDRG